MSADTNVKNPRVNVFLSKADKWQKELIQLRRIALSSGLTEEMKWGQPCYTLEGSNVFLILAYKEYCAILFMKAALLKEPKSVLFQQTNNVQVVQSV